MVEKGFNVGGEQSGHIILTDYSTTGDGLVAAMQVLAVVHKQGTAGQRSLPPLRAAAAGAAQRPLQGRPAAGGRIGAEDDRRRDGAARRARPPGRAPSGTEPVIRVMAEADDRALVDALVDDVCDAVAKSAA